MATGQENLIPLNKRTKEEQKRITTMGGIASGKVRQEKATMRKTLELMLEEIGDKEKGLTYRQLATLGLIKGAIFGNNANYKTILETIGELQETQPETPSININIVDNSELEKTLYESDN